MAHPLLSRIDTWIFDLDNTLYPPSARLFDLIDDRMGAFIARLLDCDRSEARRIQKNYFHDHGTTMAGLMHHHGVAPEEFLVDVHDIALDRIGPCARLAESIAALPGRRIIFTNADADYAARVLDARGLGGLFEGICDIRSTGYIPKPQPGAYISLVEQFAVNAATSLFAEDMARNLTPAKAMGMTTLWLDNGAESGQRELDPAAIDHQSDDLADWLEWLFA